MYVPVFTQQTLRTIFRVHKKCLFRFYHVCFLLMHWERDSAKKEKEKEKAHFVAARCTLFEHTLSSWRMTCVKDWFKAQQQSSQSNQAWPGDAIHMVRPQLVVAVLPPPIPPAMLTPPCHPAAPSLSLTSPTCRKSFSASRRLPAVSIFWACSMYSTRTSPSLM